MSLSILTGQKEYPYLYPFEYLLEFASQCKEVVIFFHNHHVVKAKLTKALGAANLTALIAPAATRWGTMQGCFKSLLQADTILNAMVTERTFISGTTKQREQRAIIKGIITDGNFITNLRKSIAILNPIDTCITMFQGDSVPVSQVYQSFLDLPMRFESMQELNIEEKQYLTKLAKSRFEFMYGDAHGLGNILDPRFIGDGMAFDVQAEVEDFLFSFPLVDGTTNEERKEQLFKEYTAYRVRALSERTNDTFRFKMLTKGSKTVVQYWQCDGNTWPLLQKVALQVFAMPCSSAASERNFSTFGFIHTKLRNRLSAEKVEKLVYIKTNALQLNDELRYSEDMHDGDVSDPDGELICVID